MAENERRRTRQQTFAKRLMDRLQTVDPDLHRQLVEAGLARKTPAEKGEQAPVISADPMAVIERALERTVETRPSLMASLGLSVIQVLSSSMGGDGSGIPTPLTVVFTDLEGFTPFTEAEGDEAASRLLRDFHRSVGPVIRGRGGRVVKRLGDGLLLTFPEPEAAVLCGLELASEHPNDLRLRAGMHTGEVVVTRDDVVGHVVNVAARVAEAADGGSVLATEAVREAASDLPGLQWGDLESRTFKGLSEAVRVCLVSAPQHLLGSGS